MTSKQFKEGDYVIYIGPKNNNYWIYFKGVLRVEIYSDDFPSYLVVYRNPKKGNNHLPADQENFKLLGIEDSDYETL